MRHLLTAFFALVCAALHAPIAQAQETADDYEVYNSVLPLLGVGDVDKLEAMSNGYLVSKARMPDGRWKLDAFHRTFEFMMGDDDTPQLLKTIEKWEKAYPASNVAPITHAYVLYRHAFNIRGGKTADKVWEEDWAPFEENLQKALAILRDKEALAKINPRWYSTMAGVMGGLGLPTQALLENARQGLIRHPTHVVTAQNTLIYLLPKWGGSVEATSGWIHEAARLSAAHEGDAFYARLYWEILKSRHDKVTMAATFDWERLKKATDDLIQRYPTAENKLQAIDVACLFHDRDEYVKRWNVMAKDAGAKAVPMIDPAIRCNWPEAKFKDPQIMDPDELPLQVQPKKTQMP